MANDRKYVGSGKKVANYDLINVTLNLGDIDKEKDIREYKGKKYIFLTLGARKNGADEHGRTHSLWINDYDPEKKKEEKKDVGNADDIPF